MVASNARISPSHYFAHFEKLYMTQKLYAYSANDHVLKSIEVFFLVAKYKLLSVY